MYSKNPVKERRELWAELTTIAPTTTNEKWLVWGDFKEILSSGEMLGSEAYDNDGLKDFLNTLIGMPGLLEMHTKGGSFTWTDERIGDDRVMSKISKMFTNDKWIETWFLMFCEHYWGGSRDHFGLEVKFHPIDKLKRPFIF